MDCQHIIHTLMDDLCNHTKGSLPFPRLHAMFVSLVYRIETKHVDPRPAGIGEEQICEVIEKSLNNRRRLGAAHLALKRPLRFSTTRRPSPTFGQELGARIDFEALIMPDSEDVR